MDFVTPRSGSPRDEKPKAHEEPSGGIAAARTLWSATPGVGLSAADEPQALSAFLTRNPGTSLVAESLGRITGTILVGHDGRRRLIHHLAALCQHHIDKCHLMVFADTTGGASFWTAIGATRRSEMELYSLRTTPR